MGEKLTLKPLLVGEATLRQVAEISEVASRGKPNAFFEMVTLGCSLAQSSLDSLANCMRFSSGADNVEDFFREEKLRYLLKALTDIERACNKSNSAELGLVRRTLRVGTELRSTACFYGGDRTQIFLPNAQVEEIAKKSSTEVFMVLQLIARLYSDGFLDFPWKRYFLTDPRVMFATLQKYNPAADHTQRSHQGGSWRFKSGNFLPANSFDGVCTSVVAVDEDYHTMDAIVDYFNEKCRMSARRSDQTKSPLEQWKDPKVVASLLNNVFKKRQDISTYNVREAFWSGDIKECTQFKPSFVVAVGRILQNVTRVLDFSAGWGDRLTGFLALGVQRYAAFDPNIKLKPGHDEIQQVLGTGTKVTIDYVPFEDAVLPPGETFDLIFTSPPFFTFEFYEGENTSTERYPEFNRWAVDFLFVALCKAWTVLDEGGHMCIYIEDSRGVVITEAMCLFVLAALPGSKTRGVIYSYAKESSGRPRPLWVFQKVSNPDARRREEAIDHLRRLFGDLVKLIEANQTLSGTLTRNVEDNREPKKPRTF